MTSPADVTRLTGGLLNELLAGVPAVLVAGPRASGKTTTVRRHATTVVRLDRPLEAAPVAADADTVLATLQEPVLHVFGQLRLPNQGLPLCNRPAPYFPSIDGKFDAGPVTRSVILLLPLGDGVRTT